MDTLLKYFPDLTETQQRQFAALGQLYAEWNEKINVISRKDIDNLYLHHVLHSLSIAKFTRFKSETTILDLGTGGGFPGIPLAIMFPECKFKLIDGTAKKIRVVNEVVVATQLKNVVARQTRGEDEQGKYHFVVSRAVMPLPELVKLVRKNISRKQINALPNGIICLKGGNVEAETNPFRNIVEITPVSTLFEEEWFKEKQILYLPI